MTRERAAKRERLRTYLDHRDLRSVWLARPNAFRWLTGGDNVVDREADAGVAAAGYDGDAVTVVTDNIEAPRLREEQLPADAEVVTFDWHADSLAGAVREVAPTPAAADFDVSGFEGFDLTAVSGPLLPAEVDRFRDLGRDAAAAVEAVCRGLDPADAERAVETRVRTALSERGIEAPVILVGGESRAPAYRHYTPTDAPIGGYALVSVTARRGGLHASLTRTVAFDPPAWLDARHRAAARVEVSALEATRAAGAGDDGEAGLASRVFDAIRAAYADAGFAGEWRNHHQGGAAGYAGREWICTPSLDRPVRLPMAFAWNPTVRGAKSEDTALVTTDGVGVLTDTGEWPTLTVAGIEGTELARPDVLSV